MTDSEPTNPEEFFDGDLEPASELTYSDERSSEEEYTGSEKLFDTDLRGRRPEERNDLDLQQFRENEKYETWREVAEHVTEFTEYGEAEQEFSLQNREYADMILNEMEAVSQYPDSLPEEAAQTAAVALYDEIEEKTPESFDTGEELSNLKYHLNRKNPRNRDVEIPDSVESPVYLAEEVFSAAKE